MNNNHDHAEAHTGTEHHEDESDGEQHTNPVGFAFQVYRMTLESANKTTFLKEFNEGIADDAGVRLPFQPFEAEGIPADKQGRVTLWWMDGRFMGYYAEGLKTKAGWRNMINDWLDLDGDGGEEIDFEVGWADLRCTTDGHEMAAFVPDFLQLGHDTTLVGRLTPDVTCGNCGRHGHEVKSCRKLTSAGDVAACPKCNTDHLFDHCPRLNELTTDELFHLLVECRANNGPIRSEKYCWVKLALESGREIYRYGYPWVHSFANEWLKEGGKFGADRKTRAFGPNVDIWKTYDYIRDNPKMPADPNSADWGYEYLGGRCEIYLTAEEIAMAYRLGNKHEYAMTKHARVQREIEEKDMEREFALWNKMEEIQAELKHLDGQGKMLKDRLQSIYRDIQELHKE